MGVGTYYVPRTYYGSEHLLCAEHLLYAEHLLWEWAALPFAPQHSCRMM